MQLMVNLYEAAACISIFCEKDSIHALADGSAATQNVLLAAKAYGVDSCWSFRL